MNNPYQTTIVICHDGERLPILIDFRSKIPLRLPNLWLLLSRRIKNQASTLEREARTIGYFHWWADKHGVDLEQRFKSGNGLIAEEINPSLYDWLRKDFTSGRSIKKIAVAPITHRSRLETIRDYVLWHMDQTLSSIDIHDNKFDRIVAKRELISRQFNKDMPSVRMNRRIGLEVEQRHKFLQIIRPDSKDNPWDESVRYRNYILCLTYLMLGLRRAEALKIYLNDLNLNGARPTLAVKRKPDDVNDPRKQEPRVKTLGRIIPLSQDIAKLFHDYIIEHRSKIPNAKKSPFLFLASNTGNPLSLMAVNNIFYQIIKKHSEFESVLTPHILRHSYNDLLSEIADEQRVSEYDAIEIRNYLCGWSRFSDQGENYRQRYIKQRATELSISHQSKIFSFMTENGSS